MKDYAGLREALAAGPKQAIFYYSQSTANEYQISPMVQVDLSQIAALLSELDRLRARLEVTPQGPDGIDARDETIRVLEGERDKLRADSERAWKLIDEHNADCTSQCAGRKIAGKTSCYMVGRMGSCHDCPLDYMIEPSIAARGMGEAGK